jgi:hypothetical protein
MKKADSSDDKRHITSYNKGMPGREDEYYAGKKEELGQPLCPFCGRPDVYPIKEKRLFFFSRTLAWSCANENCRMYRKRFPNPSWGSSRRGR